MRTQRGVLGTDIQCWSCGKVLKITWLTRSAVCSCGARVVPAPKKEEPEAK